MFKSKSLVFSAICCGFLVASATVFAATADKEGAAKSSDHHHGHAKLSGSSHHDQCSQRMSMVDLNKDGKVSKDEFMKHHEDMFAVMDTNKDGFLDESEMHHMMDQMHSKQGSSGHGHHHDSGHSHSHSDADKNKSK